MSGHLLYTNLGVIILLELIVCGKCYNLCLSLVHPLPTRSLFALGAVVAHLVYAVKSILHALDGIVLSVLDVLRLEHLAERALSLLGYQPVLPHPPPAAAEAITTVPP